MAGESITIEVAPDGTTVVSAKGFKGKSCMEATKQIEKALGVTSKDVKTTEYHEKEKASQRLGA